MALRPRLLAAGLRLRSGGSARGRGLGTWLAEVTRQHVFDDLGIRRMLLATLDAHEVYAAVGFAPLAEPERWMEIDLRARDVPHT